MKITTLRVPDDLHKHIRHQALDENVSMKAYILQALETKMKTETETKTKTETETEINWRGYILTGHKEGGIA